MIKTNGAEFKRFLNDDKFWPESSWFEEETVTINGAEDYDWNIEKISDTDVITVSGGIVYIDDMSDEPTFEAYFRHWRKKQATATFIVECPVDNADALKAKIKEHGGKVR